MNRHRFPLWLILLAALAQTACSARPLPLPGLDPARRDSLAAWLEAHGRSPEDYILSLFDTRDVVLVGEYHRIRHDEQLVQELVRRLPAAGVEVFAWEFARREDQPLLDSLMSGAAWDEALAREILFRGFVHWGYQDYEDILHAAWEANRARPAGAPPLRVIGVNDSPDWTLFKTPADRDDDKLRRAVWQGGGERYWGQAVVDQVAQGRKVLVHSGIHHAFSAYGQPIVVDGKFIRHEEDRMGQHVRAALGDRVATVYLHAPWPGRAGYDVDDVRPVEGVIDALLAGLPADKRRVAFDTRGTPFGALPARDAVYSQGYDAFTLADFCDGYVCQALFDDYQGVQVIPGFINLANLERARQGTPNPSLRDWDVERFMRDLEEEADPARFAPLRTRGAGHQKKKL